MLSGLSIFYKSNACWDRETRVFVEFIVINGRCIIKRWSVVSTWYSYDLESRFKFHELFFPFLFWVQNFIIYFTLIGICLSLLSNTRVRYQTIFWDKKFEFDLDGVANFNETPFKISGLKLWITEKQIPTLSTKIAQFTAVW